MGVHSGKFGVINGRTAIKNWTLNDVLESQKYIASNTRSGVGRESGIRDWSGSFVQYGHSPVTAPGSDFAFLGFTAPDDDEETGGTGETYAGTAIVDSIVLNWNWEASELLTITTNFSGNGVLTTSTGSQLSDVIIAVPDPTCGTKIQWLNGTVMTEWANLTNAVLTITADNKPYVNSSSFLSQECWRLRQRGNLDFTLAITEQSTTRANLPDIGDNVELNLYVDATLFWDLKWAKLHDFSNINVDVESGDIISRQANFSQNAIVNTTIGHIIDPNLSTLWPYV